MIVPHAPAVHVQETAQGITGKTQLMHYPKKIGEHHDR
jgi:hypothetical protein